MTGLAIRPYANNRMGRVVGIVIIFEMAPYTGIRRIVVIAVVTGITIIYGSMSTRERIIIIVYGK